MASKKTVSTRSKKVVSQSRLSVKATTKKLREVAKSLRKAVQDSARSKSKPIKVTKVAKELKTDSRQINRTTKASIKAFTSIAKSVRESLELSQIERLLDEDFDSLASARSALRKQSKPAKVKAPTKAKQTSKTVVRKSYVVPPPTKHIPVVTPKQEKTKRFFSLSKIRAKEGESTIEYFDRLRSKQDEIDASLNGRKIIFTYGKGKSKISYDSVRLALNRMESYDLTKQIRRGEADEDIDQDLASSVSFITLRGSQKAYSDKRQKEIKMREAERKRIQRQARKNVTKAGKPLPSLFGGSIDLLDISNKMLEEKDKRIAELEAQINGGKKNASKRSTTKKPVGKVGATKKPASKQASKNTSATKRKKPVR